MQTRIHNRTGQQKGRAAEAPERTSLPAECPHVWRGGGGGGRLWLTPCVTAALTATLRRWGARPSLSFYETPRGWSLNTGRPFARGLGQHTGRSLLSVPVVRDRTEEAADSRLPPPRRENHRWGCQAVSGPKELVVLKGPGLSKKLQSPSWHSPASKPSREELEQVWAPPPPAQGPSQLRGLHSQLGHVTLNTQGQHICVHMHVTLEKVLSS